MTKVKLDGTPSGNAIIAFADLTNALFRKQGMRIIGVCELTHVERTEPAPDEDKEGSVKLRLTGLEIARGDQEDHLRKAMDALYRHRTASGTIDEELDPQLSERTLEMTGDLLDAVEAARLRVALTAWADNIDKVVRGNLTAAQAVGELRTVARGLRQAAGWNPPEDPR